MPSKRKTFITVEENPPRKEGKTYETQVKHISVDKKNKKLSVTLGDLDTSQQGRSYKIEDLPFPRPGNKTSRFISACGVNANEIGIKICIDDLIGSHLGIIFDRSGEPVEFIWLEPKQSLVINSMEPDDETHTPESF